ncbi:response regulator [Clostridium sp. OS1-26]|uniref:response regulator n=1 Tax=Clostridium sp. OS1-26 TaxID=3070681 RepID=UPI0027DF390F|nr:response regulator [Clostridium sp. OS1-26]WML36423.1 response regulator [Clostridium sp. OS1-26]
MKKVLVVDDTKNIRMLLTTCLEIEGYEIITATNGYEALELIQNTDIDIIFLDIKMPELSGTEVLRKIRSIGINTPVIIMTAFATVKNAIDCTRLGAVVYLQKPFTTEKIKSTLKQVENLDENNIENIIVSAQKLISNGELDGAIRLLQKSISINPQCGEAYYLMGDIYRIKGDSEKSRQFFDVAKIFNYKP